MKTVAVADLKKHGKIHEDSEGEGGGERVEEGGGRRDERQSKVILPLIPLQFTLGASSCPPMAVSCCT